MPGKRAMYPGRAAGVLAAVLLSPLTGVGAAEVIFQRETASGAKLTLTRSIEVEHREPEKGPHGALSLGGNYRVEKYRLMLCRPKERNSREVAVWEKLNAYLPDNPYQLRNPEFIFYDLAVDGGRLCVLYLHGRLVTADAIALDDEGNGKLVSSTDVLDTATPPKGFTAQISPRDARILCLKRGICVVMHSGCGRLLCWHILDGKTRLLWSDSETGMGKEE